MLILDYKINENIFGGKVKMMNKMKKGFVIAAMAGLVFSTSVPVVQANAATKTCASTSKVCNIGTTFNCGNLSYKVTGKNTVTCTGFKNKKVKATSCTIPSSVTCNGKKYKVTKVANNAFKNCDSLKSIKIADSCKIIGSNAFSGCDNLTKVNLGSAVNTVSKNAFANCGKLNKINCSNKIANLGSNCFGGASACFRR